MGVTEERILEIRDTVELRDEVASVTYVSEDEAWNQFKEQYFPDGDEGILTNLDEDNPLTGMANLEISLSDASQQSDLVTYLESFEEVDHVNSLDSVAARFCGYQPAGQLCGPGYYPYTYPCGHLPYQ